jgi:hypothetical protein
VLFRGWILVFDSRRAGKKDCLNKAGTLSPIGARLSFGQETAFRLRARLPLHQLKSGKLAGYFLVNRAPIPDPFFKA